MLGPYCTVPAMPSGDALQAQRTTNALGALLKPSQGNAMTALPDTWMADTRTDARLAEVHLVVDHAGQQQPAGGVDGAVHGPALQVATTALVMRRLGMACSEGVGPGRRQIGADESIPSTLGRRAEGRRAEGRGRPPRPSALAPWSPCCAGSGRRCSRLC